MYQRQPSFVLGFHGCDHDVAEAVLAGQMLRGSENSYDWLGHGIYFWENSPERALRYAASVSKTSRGTIRRPCVIGAVIDLGRCLNLTEDRALEEVAQAYRALEMSCTSLPDNLPGYPGDLDSLKRHLDCSVIQSLHRSRLSVGQPSYDSVRSPFLEGDALYPGTHLRRSTHVQICVRQKDCIKGYFRPLRRDGQLFQPA